MAFKLAQSWVARFFPAGLGFSLAVGVFVGAQCFPAAAQWSNYDGYQVVKPRPCHLAPTYEAYPEYPDVAVPPHLDCLTRRAEPFDDLPSFWRWLTKGF